MRSSWRSSLLAYFLTVLTAASAGPRYRSVSVDSAGRLQIELDSGAAIQPPMLQGQVSFGHPAISPDHRTVGWLVMYPYPSPPGSNYVREPISGSLVLYRARRITHRFPTDQ